MLTAAQKIKLALELEYALYRQRIEPVCPINTPPMFDREYDKRQVVINARQAAKQQNKAPHA